MISIPSFAPSASKPHDKDAKREQNPRYTRYNGLITRVTIDRVAHPQARGHFFDDFSMQLPKCSNSDTMFGPLPDRSKKLTDKLGNAVSTENPRITGD